MSNRYEIREQIGKGGLGAVYKALDTQLQREVAIKRVLTTDQANEKEVKDAADKLIAEAKTLSSLNHPNIVTVFDVGQDESGGFVVMELLKGETLDETVERGVLTQEDFTEVVYQTMEALIAAQAINVIHRDIKPTNIMMVWQASGKFQLKILDFGLAKFSRSPSVQTMDQEESVMGSIFFMAPEQFERGELDARTDLYQMGCVYYNSLTGQYPFNGETGPQVMNAHLQHKVIPLEQIRPDLSPSICQWVMWMINRDISHRPLDARDALKHWPRNPEPPGAKLVEMLPIEATPEISTEEVTIVKAVSQASAPPGLIVAKVANGNTPPVTQPGTGAATGKLKTGASTGMLKPGGGADNGQKPGPGTGSNRNTASQNARTAGGAGRPNVRKTPATKANHKIKWIAIGSIASAILISTVLNSLKKGNAREREARIIELSSAEPPTGTSADIDLAVRLLNDSRTSLSLKSDAYKVLERLEGSGISEKIHEELKEADSMPVRIRLSQALAERNYTPAVAMMIETFKSASNDEQRVLLLNSVRSIADIKSINQILGALHGEHTLQVRKAYEDTVLAVLRKTGETGASVDSILTKVSTTTGSERKSLFRILGVLGGEKVKTHLAGIYTKKGDQEYQRDAMIAYLNWQSRSVIGDVESIIQTTEDAGLKLAAQKAYIRLSTLPGPEPLAELVTIWRKAIDMATNPNDARKLVASLIEYPGPETLALLKEWEGHKTNGPFAKDVAQTLEKMMPTIVTINAGDDLKGNKARVQGDGRAAINSFLSSLSGWVSPETWFSWNFKVAESGSYLVEIDQATQRVDTSQFVVYLAGRTLTGESKTTPTLEEFVTVRLDGPVELVAGQIYSLILTPGERIQPRMMDISAVRLVKP